MSIDQQSSCFSHRIIVASVILTLIGLVEIYAASSTRAMEQYGNPYLYLVKHASVCMFAIMLVLAIQRLPISYLDRAPLPLLIVALTLLVLLMIPSLAVKAGGATRWLQIMNLRFQPAELAKLAVVFFIAKNISRPSCNLEKLSHVMLTVFPAAIVCALVMLQPDFGTTVMLCITCLCMLYVAGLNSRYIIFFTSNAIVFIAAAIVLSPYRFKRLTIFLDPWSQLKEGGFQIVQSYLAFQNGGFWGTGLGESKQKLFFLPEAHTDFILSVIGEELGLLGILFVWSLFFYISYLGFRVVCLTNNRFHRYLAFGIAALITCQALFNMGVVTGLLPTKGLPLPFVSSGSSSLLIFFIAVGVLARLAKECQNEERQGERA